MKHLPLLSIALCCPVFMLAHPANGIPLTSATMNLIKAGQLPYCSTECRERVVAQIAHQTATEAM